MKNWEDLTLLQKAIYGVAIVCIAAFAPEIAILVQFGGIEVAFAFLAMYLMPLVRHTQNIYNKLSQKVQLAVLTIQTSASAKPRVFCLQAIFCCVAFGMTGSIALAGCFFMPSMVMNGVLV